MKRTALIFLIASLLLILGTATVFAAGQSQSNPFTNITLSPEKPYPGQEVVGTIKHAADLDGQNVDLEILYEQATEGELAVCKHNDCSFTATGEESKVHFYAPAKEGAYDLLFTFKVNEETHVLNSTMTVESALPEGLAQLFAGLGLFAAVMAIMAVGTEVMIETMKMFLGFKSKVTAMEAFDELKAELPGMLAGVGVDAKSREKVVKLIHKTDKSLTAFKSIPGIYEDLESGNFLEAYNELVALQKTEPDTYLNDLKDKAKKGVEIGLDNLRSQLNFDESLAEEIKNEILKYIDGFNPENSEDLPNEVIEKLSQIIQDSNERKKWLEQVVLNILKISYGDYLEELKDKAKKAVENGIEKLRDQLNIPAKMTKSIEEEILTYIDEFDPVESKELLEEVFRKLRKILQDPEEVEKWIIGQMDTYLNEGKAGINGFLADGKAALKQLGFDSDQVDNWLTPIVDGLEQTARDKAQVYAKSVKNLLEEVEERRNKMQSPFRKLWRNWRESKHPSPIFFVGLALVLFFGFSDFLDGFLKTLLTVEAVNDLLGWVAAVIFGWLSSLVLLVLFWILPNKFLLKVELPYNWTLGYILRYFIERGFNWLIGHPASIEAAGDYGKVDAALAEKIKNIGPTTLASTLLALENKHKDEETSRIRWMRIISIIVGIVLAYRLNVDAAVYFNYIVPGIQYTINAIDLNGSKFVQYWFPNGLTVGMLLTGFAASAGSKFWRDMLGRLQAARGQAEEAAQTVRKVKATLSELT